MPWILAPPISTLRSLVEDLFAKRGSSPVIRVEADNEAVMRSLVIAGGGVALMREDAALEAAAAGEIALWNKVRLETTLKFLYLQQREDDPEIRALLDVLHGIWMSAPAACASPPDPRIAATVADHDDRGAREPRAAASSAIRAERRTQATADRSRVALAIDRDRRRARHCPAATQLVAQLGRRVACPCR